MPFKVQSRNPQRSSAGPYPIRKGISQNIFNVEVNETVIAALKALEIKGYNGKAILRVSTSRRVEGKYQWAQPHGTQQEPLVIEGTTNTTLWKGSVRISIDDSSVTQYLKISCVSSDDKLASIRDVFTELCSGSVITIYPSGFPISGRPNNFQQKIRKGASTLKSYWEMKGDSYDFIVGEVSSDGTSALLSVHPSSTPKKWIGAVLDATIKRPTVSLTLASDWIIRGDSNTILIMRNLIINLNNKTWTIDRTSIIFHNVIITGGEYPQSSIKINNASMITGSAEPSIVEVSHAGIFGNGITIYSNLGKSLLYNSMFRKCKLIVSDLRIADTILNECECCNGDDSLLVEFHNTKLNGVSLEFSCAKIIAKSVLLDERARFAIRQSTIILKNISVLASSNSSPSVASQKVKGWLLEGCRGRCIGKITCDINCHQCNISFSDISNSIMSKDSHLYVELP